MELTTKQQKCIIYSQQGKIYHLSIYDEAKQYFQTYLERYEEDKKYVFKRGDRQTSPEWKQAKKNRDK